MLRLTTHNEIETLALGRALAAAVRPGDVVAIDGPLGAGKTRLVRGLALGLGFDGSVVSSPTFVVVNEYVRTEGEKARGQSEEVMSARARLQDINSPPGHLPLAGGTGRMFHVDAYRLSGPDDLDTLGWDRVMGGSAVVAIEWAERIAEALDGEQVVWRVRMEPVGSGGATELRAVSVEPPRGWRERDGAADLTRLVALVGGATPAASAQTAHLPLPQGWARCATTGKPVPPDSPTFPFADARARMADLGRWMTGSYAISREITEEDEGDAAPQG